MKVEVVFLPALPGISAITTGPGPCRSGEPNKPTVFAPKTGRAFLPPTRGLRFEIVQADVRARAPG